MSKLTYKVSYYALYAMFAVTVVVLGFFYFGGEDPNPMVPDMSQPIYTDALLYLNYALFGLAIAVTLIAFIFHFGTALKDNPVSALKSFIGVIILAAVLVVAWSMGSGEKLLMPGYDGTDNVDFWLKITDMFLYTIYFLLVVTVVAIIGSSIKKRLS
ncbi:hypothetical protein [uncultured Bacteroides sp.]|uniref:hypothetical protein n=1 Tax=uncultured Bacteroides sp. TaxID=162156 RepID=UPI002AA64A78|nr:hypothetical protein [uncultured Bacteroides sp.]